MSSSECSTVIHCQGGRSNPRTFGNLRLLATNGFRRYIEPFVQMIAL